MMIKTIKNLYNSNKRIMYGKAVISGSYENGAVFIYNGWITSYIISPVYRAVGVRCVLSKKSIYE